MSDYFETKERIEEKKNWRGYVNVPLGDGETMQLSYGLIPEDDLYGDIYPDLDLKAIKEYNRDSRPEWEEELYDLQSEDDLDDDEESRLHELQERLENHRVELVDALGKETFQAIIRAGRVAIRPDKEDVNKVLQMGSVEQERHFGRKVRTREEAQEVLTADMRETLSDNPYPVKFTIGQTALNQSGTVVEDAGE